MYGCYLCIILMVFGVCLNNIYIFIIIFKNIEYKMFFFIMVLFVLWNENVLFFYNWCNIGLNIFCLVRIIGIIF